METLLRFILDNEKGKVKLGWKKLQSYKEIAHGFKAPHAQKSLDFWHHLMWL